MSLKPYFDRLKIEAGCDEAGRGCLAGPVVAAAVILPKNFKHPLLTDSKMLSENQRESLVPIIKETALTYAVGVVDHLEIDKINILNASFLAMHRAVQGLNQVPEWLLIDGNRFNPYPNIPHTCVIKGDSKYFSIAAASILAKTYRDELMANYHQEFPMYGWDKNKGYPTKFHRNAILQQGPCHLHRKSFKLLSDEQLVLFDAQSLR